MFNIRKQFAFKLALVTVLVIIFSLPPVDSELIGSVDNRYQSQVNVFLTGDVHHQFASAFNFVNNNPVNQIDLDGKVAITVSEMNNQKFELNPFIKVEKLSQISDDLRAYILENRSNELLSSRLKFGGDAQINKIFRRYNFYTGEMIPYVPSTSNGIAFGFFRKPGARMANLGEELIEENQLLKNFASRNSAIISGNWDKMGYSLPLALKGASGFQSIDKSIDAALETVAALNQQIFFNLDYVNIDLANNAIRKLIHLENNANDMTLAASNLGFTNYELYRVTTNQELFDRTRFFNNGKQLSQTEVRNLGIQYQNPRSLWNRFSSFIDKHFSTYFN